KRVISSNVTLARVLYIIEETRIILFVDVFVCLVFKDQFMRQNNNISSHHQGVNNFLKINHH
ncbi:hypothetical protein, partial [Bacillus sp. JJ1764]|uniref:hypothetical protein n=1 Tax=Bacillus sp. JJ1764 TaxID=3122964 RepID=UPI002FFFBE7A